MDQIVPMIGGYIGKTIGSNYGGDLGGSIGYFIGQAAFSMMLPGKKQRVEGSRLSDLSIQSSAYGTTIPWFFGCVKSAGNIIWAAPLREEQTEDRDSTGKGGSKVTTTNVTYKYYGRFAVALGEQINRPPKRIWANGELMFDQGKFIPTGVVTAYTPGAMPDDGVYIAPGIKFYFGTETQNPNPYIESFVGIGKVPAHRGMAYVVFEDLALERYNNVVPQLEFELENYIAVEGPVAKTSALPENTGGVVFYPAYDENNGLLCLRAQYYEDGAALSQQVVYVQRETDNGLVFDRLLLPDLTEPAYANIVLTRVVGGFLYLTTPETYDSWGTPQMAARQPYYVKVQLDREGGHAIVASKLPNGYVFGDDLTFENGGLPQAMRMPPVVTDCANLQMTYAGTNWDLHPGYVVPRISRGRGDIITGTHDLLLGPQLAMTVSASTVIAVRPVDWTQDGYPVGGWLMLEGYVREGNSYLALTLYGVDGSKIKSQEFDMPASPENRISNPHQVFIDPQRLTLVGVASLVKLWEL